VLHCNFSVITDRRLVPLAGVATVILPVCSIIGGDRHAPIKIQWIQL